MTSYRAGRCSHGLRPRERAALEEWDRAARHLHLHPALDEVEPAFASLARPGVAEALDRARALGASEMTVVPYFLFGGVLVDRKAEEASAWADRNEKLRVSVAAEMGPDRRT